MGAIEWAIRAGIDGKYFMVKIFNFEFVRFALFELNFGIALHFLRA